jgi:hypothetical protein
MYAEVKRRVLNAMAEIPEEIQRLKGEVFFSGLTALKKGNFYLAGLNPGKGSAYPTIKQHVEEWSLETYSAYVHQCWRDECWDKDCYGMQATLTCSCVRGDSKHQRGVRRVLARCGNQDPEAVFATQAVFAKSHSAKSFRSDCQLEMRDVFNACWPLHRLFLSVVQPKVIICLGYQDNCSSFAFLRSKGSPVSELRPHHLSDSSGKKERFARFKSVNVKFDDSCIPGTPLIVGLYHPSYLERWADIQDLNRLIEAEIAKPETS